MLQHYILLKSFMYQTKKRKTVRLCAWTRITAFITPWRKWTPLVSTQDVKAEILVEKTSVFSIVCFYDKFCKKLGKVLGQVVFSDVFCVMASLVIKAKDLLIGILQFQTSHIRRPEG